MRVLENPVTGERIEVVRAEPAALELLDSWTRPGHRAAEHVHPGMEERVEVLAGRARFRVAGVEHDLGAGHAVVIPPGTPHLGWNPTDDEVRLRLRLTPARRWLEVVERLFASAREGRTDERGVPEPEVLATLLRDFPAELAPPP
ncbi:MAG TPA: cupin domain-containing protein [Solirubrobacteraceae bacterium]|jgi:quercetin dioxygenase-like cupin family protein